MAIGVLNMRFIFAILCVYILFAEFSYGAFVEKAKWSRPESLGGAYCGISDDLGATGWNPAGLAQVKRIGFSSCYSELFDLRELSYAIVGLTLPIGGIGQFGLTYSRFGEGLYIEREAIFTHSLSIKERMYFGYNIAVKVIDVSEYGRDSAICIDGGLLARINPFLRIGIASFNINHAGISKGNEVLPQSLKMGISYIPYRDILLSGEVYKEIRYPIEFRYGMEYALLSLCKIRCGIVNYPARFSGGFGFKWSIFELDYALITHQHLPLEHHFTFTLMR